MCGKESVGGGLKGERGGGWSGNMEGVKKEDGLVGVLEVKERGVGWMVGYGEYKDSGEVKGIVDMKGVKEMVGGEVKVMWGVKGWDMEKRGGMLELYGMKCREGKGGGGVEGDVVSEGRDE